MPASAHLHYGLARQYFQQQEFDQASALVDAAIFRDSSVFDFYFMRGDLENFAGNHEGAIADYQRALQLCPQLHQASYALGRVYFGTLKYEKALDVFAQAIESNPFNAEYFLFRGLAHEALKQSDAACADWQQAAALGSGPAKKRLQELCGATR